MNILVYENFPSMLEVLRRYLTRENGLYSNNVIACQSVEEVYQKLAVQDVDFFILKADVECKKLVVWLKDQEKYCDMPILMTTTRIDCSIMLDFLQLRVNDYIVKPFTSEVLYQRIMRCLQSRLGYTTVFSNVMFEKSPNKFSTLMNKHFKDSFKVIEKREKIEMFLREYFNNDTVVLKSFFPCNHDSLGRNLYKYQVYCLKGELKW